MKKPFITVLAAAILVFAAAAPASAQTAEEHKIMMPQDIVWGPGPELLPPGAEVAVLLGDPAKEGPFEVRLKMPAGYVIPPHTHPKVEAATVMSGAFHLGMGETLDREAAQTLPPGSFFSMPPGMEHYAFADEETVIELTGMGPLEITYINPADDPRNKGL